MGNFFTSSQIYNDKDLNKQQFIDKFCKAMSDSGYEVCDSDESEMSYILRFAEKSKWVAIASELYGEGGQIAQADAGRIAKMLGTYCMNTEVIDSDCAAIFLYNKDGKKADMLLMGRYDDYFGDDTPEPNKKIWTQFLSDGSTWEQFKEILGGEYVFVEDGLAQLAPVIGMDSGNLLFSAEDDVDDESAVFLDFKKAEAKKEKKLTLNAAFKQIFGEALEPLGFKKVKSKYPYYVRVINNEIVQVISFYNEKDGDYQTYTVVGGIATPYRKKIDFSVRPSCHMEWLGSNSKYYFFSDPSDYSYEYDGYLHEVYLSQTADSNKLLIAMKQSFEDVKKWMLPVFNDITTIDDTIIFYLNYHSDCFGLRKEIFDQGLYTQDNEILLLSQIQNEDLVIEKYIQKLKQHNEFEAKIGRAACQVNIEKAKEKLIDSIQYLKYNKKYLALANEYKIRNTEILKSFNFGNLLFSSEDDVDDESAVFLDFKKAEAKKEKKLTLNAAFKQVFGEALEPLGFKKVKSRYPYYARLVNDEIVQVITIVSRPDDQFEILGGIATIYRQELPLDISPKYNEAWLRGNHWYSWDLNMYGIEMKHERSKILEFYSGDHLEKEMYRSLDVTKDIMLNIFDKVDTIEKCIYFYDIFGMDIRIHHMDDFGNHFPVNYYNEGLLIVKTMDMEQYSALMDKHNERVLRTKMSYPTYQESSYERLVNKGIVYKENQCYEYKKIISDAKWLKKLDIELNKRRENNIKLLQEYKLM